MRLFLIIILTCIIQILHAGVYNDNFYTIILPPDSLPPSPPGQAADLSGPTSACLGDVSQYTVDVPVACTCQWTINGIIQPETGSVLNVTWTGAGPKTVSVVFICAGGQTSDPESLSVSVFETPEQPTPISGDGFVCEYTYHTYSTLVDPWDSCKWNVNGILQPGYLPQISYLFGEDGNYQFSVIAYNPCGTSIARTRNIIANSSVPPEVFLGNDTTILQGQTLTLDAGNPGSNYLWSTGATTQTLPVTETGTYSVNVSNFCGEDADTINVSVYVGLAEYQDDNACFRINYRNGIISFPDLPGKDIEIQLVNLSGSMFYEGPPKELKMNGKGIWLIRFISPEKTCYRKILVL